MRARKSALVLLLLVAAFVTLNGLTLRHSAEYQHCYSGPKEEPCTNIDVSNRQLKGTLPTELGLLTSLTSLNLRNNDFTGNLPTELNSLSLLSLLDVTYNTKLCGEVIDGLNSRLSSEGTSLGYKCPDAGAKDQSSMISSGESIIH
ncbi:hypothetical protein CYMTET_53939 [Cymbomonas tetramitiformis]|uniref:Uncharacterized protein n=1 Tax=Cymbomonas tetramitiformis TaxID=36881 RepID=A0AAE0EPK8_9CHLO|nr:hypothetical protein CYMTET_53939 [Cymbomonas tetramitiformis]